jgi:hypothetical protein
MKSEARMAATRGSRIWKQGHHILRKDKLSIALPGGEPCISEFLRTLLQTEVAAWRGGSLQVFAFAIENIFTSTFWSLGVMMVRDAGGCLTPLAGRISFHERCAGQPQTI